MLAVTENAAAAIRDITDQQSVPDGAGLRIATDQEAGALTLSLAASPAAGDQVVDASGALLFLDAGAAEILADKALDAAVGNEGAVEFAVAEQPK
ncbi:hypothetical protein [Mangrovihabitans endophyticus]|uniref:Fe-S cluster assembly iron-binding protein IscA n=1 Tax=Mangrovihabitans endophyticus TaxID=1751298 RepID=A0A8J3C2H0_9ACTN|nr:hypothetical protein [Mangrovihabitans endophyticus]GGL00126.1 hypothetical protein GCM10012284_38170 [Mangrovihabitans endophyticus]